MIIFILIFSTFICEKKDYNIRENTQDNGSLDFENKIPIPRGIDSIKDLQLGKWPIGETIRFNLKQPDILLGTSDSLYFDFLKIDIVSGYSVFSNFGDSLWTKDEGFIPIEMNKREYESSYIKTVKSLAIIGRLKLSDNFESVLFKVEINENSFYKDSSMFLLNYNSEFASVIKIAEIYSGEVSFEINTMRTDVNCFTQFTSYESLPLECFSRDYLKNGGYDFSLLEDGQVNLNKDR